MVGLAALEALAHCASRELTSGALVGAWMDAYRRDVFSALYRVTDAPLADPDRLAEVEPPRVASPVTTWARWSGHVDTTPAVVIGDGAMLYRDAIVGARVVPAPLLAGMVGRLAAAYARRGSAVDPSAVHPFYVRRPDVEITRENSAPLGPQQTQPRR
jgi:tRNA A37 threonylcarbamoyladenosine modification protein TsaB